MAVSIVSFILGVKNLSLTKKSFISLSNFFLVTSSALSPKAFFAFLTMLPPILSICNIAFSATFWSLAILPSIVFSISKPSWVLAPLALKGLDMYWSIHLLNLPVIAFPVPVWFLNLEIVLPATPNNPVKAVPSIPNFNLFNISASGVSFSLSNPVGPPNKSPKLPTSSTSSTNKPSAIPPNPAPVPYAKLFSVPVAVLEKASSTNLLCDLVNLSPFNFFWIALEVSPPKSKYLSLRFAINAPLANPLPTLKATPPGTPMLTISSVILPAVVASAISSKGFILAKNSSTSAALSVSAPISINVAPSETKPSGILNKPEPIPAKADTNALGLLFSSAGEDSTPFAISAKVAISTSLTYFKPWLSFDFIALFKEYSNTLGSYHNCKSIF